MPLALLVSCLPSITIMVMAVIWQANTRQYASEEKQVKINVYTKTKKFWLLNDRKIIFGNFKPKKYHISLNLIMDIVIILSIFVL